MNTLDTRFLSPLCNLWTLVNLPVIIYTKKSESIFHVRRQAKENVRCGVFLQDISIHDASIATFYDSYIVKNALAQKGC